MFFLGLITISYVNGSVMASNCNGDDTCKEVTEGEEGSALLEDSASFLQTGKQKQAFADPDVPPPPGGENGPLPSGGGTEKKPTNEEALIEEEQEKKLEPKTNSQSLADIRSEVQSLLNAKELTMDMENVTASDTYEVDENAVRRITKLESSCPQAPASTVCSNLWHSQAYCNNRQTLNGGLPVTLDACAFLVNHDSRCGVYSGGKKLFYTTATGGSTGGVCKCCQWSTGFYVSSQCNNLYTSEPSCFIPR